MIPEVYSSYYSYFTLKLLGAIFSRSDLENLISWIIAHQKNNGAIYNHTELRKELEPYYKFRSNHSDTEVIIYAYKKWGLDFIQRLNGMFAIALYDKAKKDSGR
jgi:asparagine synthetase B (glutamine-hydrolysing)